jgi:hypothetical protein
MCTVQNEEESNVPEEKHHVVEVVECDSGGIAPQGIRFNGQFHAPTSLCVW